MTESPPQSLGRYTIRAEIGRGGFATVYRALDTSLNREVALKILHPQLLTDRTFAERFRKEARALAALRHPHIVTVYEVGEAEGRLYIAVELARGPSLAQAIAERGHIPWSETIALLKPVCEALDYAHAQGIVHRDLKPANILLDKERGALLTDFGFARLMGESSVSMSLSGGVMGTPAYIAPEVWEFEAAKPAADIYALGCIVFEMLTGQVLFAGKTPMQAMRAHDKGPQFPSAWPEGVPAEVEAVLRQASARQPEARFPSASVLWQALNDIQVDTQAQREKAERAAVAAQWRVEAEAALASGEWSAARMAVGRWLAITPDDPAALAMRQEIERRESDVRAKAEAEQRAQREAEERQRREAERKVAQEAERKMREDQARQAREEQAEREREAERLRQYRLAQAGQKANDMQTRQPSPEQIEQVQEAERLRQYRMTQEAEEQKAREATQLTEEEKRQREMAARPTQVTPQAIMQPIDRAFVIWWTVATAIAAPIGLLAGALTSLLFGVDGGAAPFPTWTVLGLFVGLAQYLVLRRRIAGAGWWILASGVDWSLGMIIGGALLPAARYYNSYWEGWSYVGLSLAAGIAQWLVLRQSMNKTGLWIPISLVGWLIAWGAAMWIVYPNVRYDPFWGVMSPTIVAAIVGGGLTGLALMRISTANKNLTGP